MTETELVAETESGSTLHTTPGDAAATLLATVVAELPGGVRRDGQASMCDAVSEAITRRRHLLVQAGTGIGKGLAYLAAGVTAAQRTVVVTATKALQEQLCTKDLPALAAAADDDLSFTLLKGRANYLCLARKAEIDEDRASTLELGDGRDADALADIDAWVAETDSGDRADLPNEVSNELWARLSVDSRECPGRARCELSEACFAEQARERAAAADVIVVNAALYGRDLEANGAVLPDHDLVVIDEAHTFEDFASDAFGEEIGPGRLRHLAGAVGKLFVADPDTGGDDPAGDLHDWADRVDAHFSALPDDAPVQLPDEVRDALGGLAEMLAALSSSVSKVNTEVGSAAQAKLRVTKLVESARIDIASVLAAREGEDALWVERRRSGAVLHSTAVDVGPPLRERLFARRTAVLTSATLATGGDFSALAWRLGLRGSRTAPDDVANGDTDTSTGTDSDTSTDTSPNIDRDTDERLGIPDDPDAYVGLDVGSPFDYRHQAILYVAAHLPDPRTEAFEAAMLDEVEALARAAGGRTLGLCTSLRMADALRDRLRAALNVNVYGVGDLPRPQLLAEFARDETSCLVGSMSLWQGIDVPGPSLSVVAIDKIPFARPTDPYAVARRDHAAAAGHEPFTTYDLPRAAMLLAQGAGRLVRNADDRGVVAILDPRVVTKRYGRDLVKSLPPMFRMTDPGRVRSALERLVADPEVIEA